MIALARHANVQPETGKGYLNKVLENDAVSAYVGRNAPEILEQFELVLNTISMEEAVEQAERGDGAVRGQATDPADAEGTSADAGANESAEDL